MSNNPFLKTNNSVKPNNPVKTNNYVKPNNSVKPNNRFEILNNDINNTSDTKKEKNISQYETTNNSFTKVNNSKNIETLKNLDFVSSQELFPELILKSNDITQDNNSKKKSDNYKNAINLHVEDSKNTTQNKINRGWIEIKIVNGKIITTNGPISTYEIKKEKESNIKNSPHFIMNKSIKLMQKNWNMYRDYYDNLYGEGSYNETYISSPIYGSEYDTDSDEDYDDKHNQNEDEDYDF